MANEKFSQWVSMGALAGTEKLVGLSGADNEYTTPADLKTYIAPQSILVSSSAATSTASTIPIDNSKPQNSEGAALSALDCAITPTSATNIIRIEFSINLSFNAGGAAVHKAVVALFKDSVTDALLAQIAGAYENGLSEYIITGMYEEVAGSTSARTYKIRYGTNGDTVYVNSAAGSAVFGGVCVSWIRATEVRV